MPNVATVLKEEISRLARKEIRGEAERLKKANAQSRADIVALKRRVQELEQLIRKLSRAQASGPRATAAATDESSGTRLRFSAKGLASQRKRLGLSAAEVGLILGVSGQSIYKWEDGSTRPRASQLPAIAELRKMGKREATARLAELAGSPAADEAA